jgi:hypothetical protein
VRDLIEKFCEERNILFPETKQEFLVVLTRMKNIGILSQEEINVFMRQM